MISTLLEIVQSLGLIALLLFLVTLIVAIMQGLIKTITKGGRKNE